MISKFCTTTFPNVNQHCHQDPLAHLDLQDHVEMEDLQDLSVQVEAPEDLEQEDLQDHRDHKDHQVHPETVDLKEAEVYLVQVDRKVDQDLKAIKDHLVQQDKEVSDPCNRI